MTTIPTATEASVSLAGTASVVVPIFVGDAEGNVLSGDAFDPGATVTVADDTVCTAELSADQTTVTVTGLNTAGLTTVTVNASVNGVALTDFGGPLLVSTTVEVDAPATVVFQPPAAS